jgi:heme exporter protein C
MNTMFGFLDRHRSVLGMGTLGMLLVGTYLGLVWSPPDVEQHDAMRILYVHVPSIWTAYLGFFLVLVASVMFLWKRDLRWDQLAVTCAELGVFFTALTLAVGSIWAKPIWGVWWTWDPRVTTTAILFVIYVGYLAFRSVQPDPITRARQSAVIGVVGFIDIPVVHMSVLWWRSLHQGPTLQGMNGPLLDPRMEVALLVNTIAFTLLFVYLLVQRMQLVRTEALQDEVLREALTRE